MILFVTHESGSIIIYIIIYLALFVKFAAYMFFYVLKLKFYI